MVHCDDSMTNTVVFRNLHLRELHCCRKDIGILLHGLRIVASSKTSSNSNNLTDLKLLTDLLLSLVSEQFEAFINNYVR